MIQGGGFEPGMKQKPTGDADRERSRQRPEERARHRRHGAHLRPAFGHRAVLHQRRRQRLPRLHGADGTAGATASSAASSKAWTSSTRSRASRPAARGFHQDVPVEDVVIERAEVVLRPWHRAALFVSDLHLSAAQAGDGRICSSTSSPARARDADALYILGDLFDYWARRRRPRRPLQRRASAPRWQRWPTAAPRSSSCPATATSWSATTSPPPPA